MIRREVREHAVEALGIRPGERVERRGSGDDREPVWLLVDRRRRVGRAGVGPAWVAPGREDVVERHLADVDAEHTREVGHAEVAVDDDDP